MIHGLCCFSTYYKIKCSNTTLLESNKNILNIFDSHRALYVLYVCNVHKVYEAWAVIISAQWEKYMLIWIRLIWIAA